ncbi:ATP-dependent helicase [Fulvivirga sp.]|uniref:ATP-dependent helicase n=1 Tax=Fulvivirga sp. TaxID=1931237 RepID=UPI0032F067C9
MNESFYADLESIKADEHQYNAYSSKGNSVIIAGPGSGKTRVLTLKAIQLIQSSNSRNTGLACISYSRETVRELKNRLHNYGYRSRPIDYIGTVHGFCLAEIIIPFQSLYPEFKVPQPFKIASGEVVNSIYRGILKDLDKTEYDISKLGIDRERLISIVGESEVVTDTNPLYSSAAKLFEDRLMESGVIDFTQITKTALQLIQQKDYVRKSLESKFPYLLIDEYQDLGKALHEMVLSLHGNTDIIIYAVGDMDQSIYGFQGAYPDFLLELYDRDDFESHRLIHNYRSNEHIINASLTALDPPPPVPEYKAQTRTGESADFSFISCYAEMIEQYNCVANKVVPKLLKQDIIHKEIAIITGSNDQAFTMAMILNNQGLPAYVAKWNFDTRSDIIQWLMECAAWCNDPQSKSFKSIFSFWEYLIQSHSNSRIYKTRNQIIIEFQEILETARLKQQLLPWLKWIIGNLDMGELLRDSERYPDDRENLIMLFEEAKTGKLQNAPYIKLTRLSQPDNEITVITRHSVKGLEFEAVIMLGMEQGNFPWYSHKPGSKEYDEDKRICYVCVSRAKKACIMLYSKVITKSTKFGSRTDSYQPSVFYKQLYSKFGNESNTYTSESY